MRQSRKTTDAEALGAPGESDRFSTKERPRTVERRVALARPHPEGARPHVPDGLQPEEKADLAEQPSETNPISSKSGP